MTMQTMKNHKAPFQKKRTIRLNYTYRTIDLASGTRKCFFSTHGIQAEGKYQLPVPMYFTSSASCIFNFRLAFSSFLKRTRQETLLSH